MKALLLGLAVVLFWIVVFYVPLFLVMWRAKKARDEYEAEAKEPFTDLPLRLPGESTRKKADEHFEKAVEGMLLMAAAAALAGFAAATTPEARQPMVATTFGVMVVGLAIFTGPRVLASLRKYWDYKLGFTGERVVAEELNQLLVHGWRVFHDVPFLPTTWTTWRSVRWVFSRWRRRRSGNGRIGRRHIPRTW